MKERKVHNQNSTKVFLHMGNEKNHNRDSAERDRYWKLGKTLQSSEPFSHAAVPCKGRVVLSEIQHNSKKACPKRTSKQKNTVCFFFLHFWRSSILVIKISWTDGRFIMKQITCPHLCQLNIISCWAAAGVGAVFMATGMKLMWVTSGNSCQKSER